LEGKIKYSNYLIPTAHLLLGMKWSFGVKTLGCFHKVYRIMLYKNRYDPRPHSLVGSVLDNGSKGLRFEPEVTKIMET
jgi:hypothetical protein